MWSNHIPGGYVRNGLGQITLSGRTVSEANLKKQSSLNEPALWAMLPYLLMPGVYRCLSGHRSVSPKILRKTPTLNPLHQNEFLAQATPKGRN